MKEKLDENNGIITFLLSGEALTDTWNNKLDERWDEI